MTHSKAALASCLVLLLSLGVGCRKKPTGGVDKASGELQRIFALQSKIHQKLAESGVASLSRPELVFHCVNGVENEVNNGGFHQYFFNSDGDFAQDAAGAFRDINAEHTATLVEKACAVFPGGTPPRDRAERQNQLEQIGETGEKLLDDLDTQFYEYKDDIEQLLIQYIDKHSGDFE